MSSETLPYQGVGTQNCYNTKIIVIKALLSIFKKNKLIMYIIAFLLGKVILPCGYIPFTSALYLVAFSMDINIFLLFSCIVVGIISGQQNADIYNTVLSMLVITFFNAFYKISRLKTVYIASLGGMCTYFSELLLLYSQKILFYDILKAFLHAVAVFCFVFIFDNAVKLIDSKKKRYILKNEDIISIAILLSLALASFSGLELLRFNIRNILSVLLVLVFGNTYGAAVGAASGVCVGMINVNNETTPVIIGTYAFCGLLSGIFKNMGRLGAGFGFIVGNAVLAFYLNASSDVLIYTKEILAAVIIFVTLPEKFVKKAISLFRNTIRTEYCTIRDYGSRIKDMTVERLKKFSNAFEELSKTFSSISETNVVVDKGDVTALFEKIADKVCKDCSLSYHCWDRNFCNTYQTMYKITEKLERKGYVDSRDIPQYLLSRCQRVDEIILAINNIYEIFKIDIMWKKKIGESRRLVSQQLGGMAQIVDNLAKEMDLDIKFKSEMEDIILDALNKANFKVFEVCVFENRWGNLEISVLHKGCGGRRECLTTISSIVSDVAGKKMLKDCSECCCKANLCKIDFAEEQIFSVNVAVAKLPKYGGEVSGDSYTLISSERGKYIIALSDGMGSGQRASIQSRAAVNLLEQFIESGFDKYTIVKLINSVLVLKSDEDSFTTIDVAVIDLFNGEAEFIKIGAVPTYIKKNERIDMIKNVSLPAGILSDIEMEAVIKKVESGEFIIMMSDGIIDSFEVEKDKGGGSLIEFIAEIKSINPQQIADSIINRAYLNYSKIPTDDMMVIVAKIWRRAS